MSDEELRKKIYERLSLEFASLPSESGNDWQRAKDEVLEEQRQKDFEKLKNIKSTDYLSIDKDSEEFKMVLNSSFVESYNLKILLAQRNDLTTEEIDKLISFEDKDILINLSRFQKLTKEHIDKMLPISVYLCKKNLIENQNFTAEQKSNLIELMKNSSLDYKNLIDKLNTNSNL
ncbi:hypothetical protein [Aliarcobacter butzleri]|uniref:hypothetical protein n=1 Tax=Aliarcobacter butzleri TaxID=28197 RepID=UPI002B2486A7|nr:hypothetical protein [Aliarcobacter butzleri]